MFSNSSIPYFAFFEIPLSNYFLSRLFWTKDSGFLSQFEGKSPTDSIVYKPISAYPQVENKYLSESMIFLSGNIRCIVLPARISSIQRHDFGCLRHNSERGRRARWTGKNILLRFFLHFHHAFSLFPIFRTCSKIHDEAILCMIKDFLITFSIKKLSSGKIDGRVHEQEEREAQSNVSNRVQEQWEVTHKAGSECGPQSHRAGTRWEVQCGYQVK